MAEKVDCPRCTKPLNTHVLVDSDERIYAKWRWCRCGYDTRTCPPEGISPPLTAAKG